MFKYLNSFSCRYLDVGHALEDHAAEEASELGALAGTRLAVVAPGDPQGRLLCRDRLGRRGRFPGALFRSLSLSDALPLSSSSSSAPSPRAPLSARSLLSSASPAGRRSARVSVTKLSSLFKKKKFHFYFSFIFILGETCAGAEYFESFAQPAAGPFCPPQERHSSRRLPRRPRG